MLNKVCIQGRFARDPELKTTAGGKSVVSFSLACDRVKRDEGADFITCTAWERTAEMICQWFRKGQEAIVSGRLGSRKYQDKYGNQRTLWEVTVSEIHFCGKKSDVPSAGASEQGTAYGGEAPAQGPGHYPAQGYEAYMDEESELPF